MKRGLLKSILGTALMLFVANGLMAQIPASYEAISGDNTIDIDSITIGDSVGYYVLPDLYFHPSYVGSGTLSTGFTWNWADAGATGDLRFSDTTDGAQMPSNYVVVKFPDAVATNLYEITVNEQAPESYGGCAGDDTNMFVRVIAAPTITFNSAGGYISDSIEVCENNTQLNDLVGAAITSAGQPTYQILYTLEIATLGTDHITKDEYFDVDKASLGGTQAYARNYAGTLANAQVSSIATATPNLDEPTDGDFTAIGGKTTVYTYVINGVNDRISRKSNYLANTGNAANLWTWHDTTAESIAIVVNPRPVTGPIYHIPNDWAN